MAEAEIYLNSGNDRKVELTPTDINFLRKIGKCSGPATDRDFRHDFSPEDINGSSRRLAEIGYITVGSGAEFGTTGGMRTVDRMKTYQLTPTGMAYVQFKFGEGNRQ